MNRILLTALAAAALSSSSSAHAFEVWRDCSVDGNLDNGVLTLHFDGDCAVYATAVGSRVHIFRAKSTRHSDGCEAGTIEPIEGTERFLSYAQDEVDVIQIDGDEWDNAIRVEGLDVSLKGHGRGGDDHFMSDVNVSIYGGDGSDCMVATGGGRMRGNDGQDKIYGLGDSSYSIWGYDGDDHIKTTGGNDFISGGSGSDIIDAGYGDDDIYGGGSADQIKAGNGHDYVEGGSGADRLEGGPGDDILYGGPGEDKIWGGAGDDELYGGGSYLDVDDFHGGTGTDNCLSDPVDTVTACEW